ncbi:disease resistance protein RPV1-like isoform X1 [Pyrus x bretschneideri]|uniref:disease resistance protein RPV1-like isoform X1 n=3 Tax=Pyrus x bretschneideri TaxID=225117 RepID=UPI00202FA810|nr:disease resistance protein RPV1-like isoform X1 [Pyrus x bretschneideri]
MIQKSNCFGFIILKVKFSCFEGGENKQAIVKLVTCQSICNFVHMPNSEMELIGFIQVFNIIVIAIGTLLYMCCRSFSSSSPAADSDVADSVVPDSAADSTAVVDDADVDNPPHREKYDVFISFRGEDTRLGITSHLHAALLEKKIETYIDNRLQRGEEIRPALLEAIEKSTISVIIFSQNYASSTWCLDELVHILKCNNREGRMVIPVFYDINASDVRKQHGSYADAFAQLEKRFDNSIDKVHKWRDALTTAANLSGFDHSKKSGTEADLIKNVVDCIWTKLICESSCDLEGLVGIESHIQQIEELLAIHSQDACISVGIWGMGGIGKTTLAEAVFNRLSSKFEACCFLRNVREREQNDGLEHLEKTLLKEILKEEGLSMGSTFVRDRLRRTKVLIILDDVSDSIQLERLAGKGLRYGTGSRIIITSRDRRTLTEEGKIYEVEGLKQNDALQLFCSRAFKNNSTPRAGYKELAEKAVDYAGGVPLALKLLGSLFFNCNSKADWEDELDKLKEFPYERLQRVLRLSFDGLGRNEKEIFLDIACFHKGNEVKEVRKRLAIRGRFAEAGIKVLVHMSLISIKLTSRWEIIEMHDLLEEMGRTIVQEQCIDDPGKRNRLFNDEDIYRVLKSNKEAPTVQAITFDWSKIKKRPLNRANLKVMSNLKVLIVDSFVASLDLPDSLRYLYWPSYLLESLPSNFSPENLVELHMRYSNVKKLCKEDQILVNLEVIDLKHSWNLTELPNLSGSLKVVSIDLFGCTSLVEIPWSFQHLDKLTHLDVGGCISLEYLPEMPRNIKYLDLHNSGIKELPESVWSNENISHLDITGCKYLEKLPSNRCKLKVSGCFNLDGCISLGEFSELPRDISKLSLVGCKKLVSLPDNIYQLKYLKELDLSSSSELENFPEILEPMKHLKSLNLSGTAIKELHSSIEFLPALKRLELQCCKRLSSIPKSICKLKYLEELNLSSSSKLGNFPELNRSKLGNFPELNRSQLGNFPELNLFNSSELENFPEILEPMKHLKSLNLSGTAIKELHSSIEFLPALKRLELQGCKRLSSIPKSICKLKHLEELNLSSCSELENFPEILEPMRHLKSLNLSGTMIKELHSSIEFLPALKRLELQGCKRLSSIRKRISKFEITRGTQSLRLL